METWPFGELLCKVVLSIDYYNMFTSIFTLTMMSVDRYVAVCHPVKALDFRTPAKAKIINVCIWVLSSVIGVPIMVMAVTKSKGKWLWGKGPPLGRLSWQTQATRSHSRCELSEGHPSMGPWQIVMVSLPSLPGKWEKGLETAPEAVLPRPHLQFPQCLSPAPASGVQIKCLSPCPGLIAKSPAGPHHALQLLFGGARPWLLGKLRAA